MRVAAGALGLLLQVVALSVTCPVAQAEPSEGESEPEEPPLEPGRIPIQAPDRITGIAQLGIGWLTLPRALVCRGGTLCRRGDTTPVVEIWNLVRLDLGLAFGAGITLGLVPTTEVPRDDPPGVSRSHRRGYMTIESLVRYYPWRTHDVEGWFGGGAGLVIVSDTFVTDSAPERYAFVGSPGVTLRTEGLSLLAGMGVSVVLSEYWTVGFQGRAGIWRLPDDPVRSPLGDEASLSGTNTVIYAGISVSFQQLL